MSDTPLVRLERHGGLARLTLADGDHGNPLGTGMTSALRAAAVACDDDAGVRAVLVVAEGRSFSVGGDLREMVDSSAPARMVRDNATNMHAAVSILSRMEVPLLVAVHGIAAGAGMALALTGDIVLAAESARFTMAYTRVGLTPDGGATYVLPRVVGLRKAQELTLLNPVIGAEEAERLGIVTRVVADADLRAEAERLAQELAHGPSHALGRSAALLRDSAAQTLETQMELEARAVVTAVDGAEGREGREAFLAKRAARYYGG